MNLPTALLTAIIVVESGGENTISKDGRHFGLYQLSAIFIKDINRIQDEQHFIVRDALDRYLAEEMVKIYIAHYATKERLGHTPTEEDAVRIFKGGPRGWEDPKTKKYWLRVEALLQGQLSVAKP